MSYTNRNLILRDLALNDQERVRLLNVDASKIGAKTLSMNLEAVIGAGTISGSMTLNETRSSLNTKIHLLAERIEAAALSKYLGLPEGFIGGQIERFSLDGTGMLNKPNSWTATMSAQANDLRCPAILSRRATARGRIHRYPLYKDRVERRGQ